MLNSTDAVDYDNIERVVSRQPIDAINSQFYGKFPYPWSPHIIRRLADPAFERQLLDQSIGSWSTGVLPARPRIWVAGCGTNQAVLTALRFPTAQVLGTDLSAESLAASRQLADEFAVTNLELRAESINDAEHAGAFDHVICTGVIHHNADPQAALARLAGALTQDGVLELMVYNRYHCVEAMAVQKAMAIIGAADAEATLDSELALAKSLVAGRDELKQRVARFFPGMEYSDAAVADALIQPVMHTFTVLDLQRMANSCGLDVAVPCVNQFDVARNCFDWNSRIPDPELREKYEALDDVARWQVTNLIGLEQSPMIWFYLRRSGATRPRRPEREILAEFSEQVFEVAETTSQKFVRTESGKYEPAGRPARYPARPAGELCTKIVARVAERRRARMRDVLAELAMPDDFATLSQLRVRLTTTAFPYLRSVRSA